MSPIGRIFVVINLVLAALFLGSAAANLGSQQKYRNLYELGTAELEATKVQLAKDIESLRAEKNQAEALRNEVKNQKDALETAKVALEQDLASKRDELNQVQTSFSNVDSRLGDMATQLENQSSQVEQANNERVAAVEARREAESERNSAVEAQAAAEDQVNELNSQIASLRTELNGTREELSATQTTLAVAIERGGFTVDQLGMAAPTIEGAVLQVATNVKPGLVHINRGSADSVQAGFVFDIFNSGVYKGRARVEIVNSDSCTARIINKVDGTTIMQGDSVSTRI